VDCAARNPGENPIVRDGGGCSQQSDGVWRSDRRKFPRVFFLICSRIRFISIFSMLFGAGIVSCGRRRKFGRQTDTPAYRRVGWMILFRCSARTPALVWRHSLYIRNVRAFRLSLRSKSPRTLISSALVLAAIGSLIAIGLGLFWVPHWPADIQADFIEDWQPSPQSINEELAAYRGSWIDQMSDRVPSALDIETSEFPHALWLESLEPDAAWDGASSSAHSTPVEPPPVPVACGVGLLVGIPMIIVGVV